MLLNGRKPQRTLRTTLCEYWPLYSKWQVWQVGAVAPFLWPSWSARRMFQSHWLPSV